jgi:hypothetical protein
MAKLAAHVAELNTAREKLARVGVSQVLHRPVSQVGAGADPSPLARSEVVGVDPFEDAPLRRIEARVISEPLEVEVA